MTTNNENADEPLPSPIRVLTIFGVVTIVVLLVIRVTLGRTVVEKIATMLAMPCGIIWYLLMCCLVLVFSGRQRKPAAVLLVVWLLYTASGSGHLACLLVKNMEAPFFGIKPLQEKPFDAIIVLGGGASVGGNGRFQGNSSGDRIILAAQLYHAGITQKLICTGRRIESVDGQGTDPSEISMGLLSNLGVPESAIERLGGHNTSEEMQNLSQRFDGPDSRVGLVTSAWHLPRALRLARKNGLAPVPLPADFMGGPEAHQTMAQLITSCIPQADNFTYTTRILKEHLAGIVGR